MGKTIALMNQKGGVGKTTMTATLGIGLAALGYDVVIADADPQGHQRKIHDLFGDDPTPEYLYELVTGRRTAESALCPVPVEKYNLITPSYLPRKSFDLGSLSIIPGEVETSLIPGWIRVRNWNWTALADALEPIRQSHDFVLIDTPPTVNELTPAIVRALDQTLILTETEKLSTDQINKTIDSMANLQSVDTIIGIQPTMAKRGAAIHDLHLTLLRDAFGDLVWPEINWYQSWVEACTASQSVMQYARRHTSADQAWLFVGRVLATVGVTA